MGVPPLPARPPETLVPPLPPSRSGSPRVRKRDPRTPETETGPSEGLLGRGACREGKGA